MLALTPLVSNFACNGDGLGVVPDGLVELRLGLVEVSEIAQSDALNQLVSEFSVNGKSLVEGRDGLFVFTLGLVDPCEAL